MITIVLDPEEIIRDCILDVFPGNAQEARETLREFGYGEERIEALTFQEHVV